MDIDKIRNAVHNAGWLDEDSLEQTIFLVDTLGPIIDTLRKRVDNAGIGVVELHRDHLKGF